MKHSIPKKIIFLLCLCLIMSSVACNSKASKDDIEYETVTMDWISEARANFEDNQFAAEDLNGKPIEVVLEIEEITSTGFSLRYGWESQTTTMWADTLEVKLSDPSVLKNYKIGDSVTVRGKTSFSAFSSIFDAYIVE